MENGVRVLYEGAKANATTLNGWLHDYLRAECENGTLELDARKLQVRCRQVGGPRDRGDPTAGAAGVAQPLARGAVLQLAPRRPGASRTTSTTTSTARRCFLRQSSPPTPARLSTYRRFWRRISTLPDGLWGIVSSQYPADDDGQDEQRQQESHAEDDQHDSQRCSRRVVVSEALAQFAKRPA